MRAFALECLFWIGSAAMVAALACAFWTFALMTNDYRPIMAAGVGFSLLAVACFAGLIRWRPQQAVLYFAAGVLPSLLALAYLGYRIIYWMLG